MVILNKHDLAHEAIIVGILLAVMALNLLTLWNTDAILKHVSPGVLYLVGWVLAVLQAIAGGTDRDPRPARARGVTLVGFSGLMDGSSDER